MSLSKDMWMREVDLASENYAHGKIDDVEFIKQMRALGFDDDEIEEHMEAARQDRESNMEPAKS